MSHRHTLPFSRWWLIISGALAMGMAGTFQFVWSAIRGPLGAQIGATEATLGTLFTVVIATQTVSQLPAGWFRDRYGPRLPTLAGAILITGGYVGLATAITPMAAFVSAAAGGAGAGAIYTVAVNTPVKLFDERRGLATGILTMSYALLSFALIPVARGNLLGSFMNTLLGFAGIAGIVCLIAAVVLRDPDIEVESVSEELGDSGQERMALTDDRTNPSEVAYTWHEIIRTWQFWVLYAAFALINGVGLMLIGKVIAFADTLELSAGIATIAASIIAVADGAGGLLVGGLSDRLGLVRTAGTALFVSAIGIVGAVVAGHLGIGVGFVICVAVAGFFRSPVFAIFPNLIGTYYGSAYSSENYAVLYTAKLWGSVFAGTVASLLIATIGWSASFLIGGGLMALAGILVFAVRPISS